MSRKDALLRLHKNLLIKRDELRRQLTHELEATGSTTDHSGDLFDVALDGSQNEMNSQLAAFETSELKQIERAIRLIRQGRYGSCEVCDTRIPIERLKALPFTTVCISCRQKQEVHGRAGDEGDGDWESVYEYEGAQSDRDLTLRDIDIELE